MDNFEFNSFKITNFEMETAAIYGLGALLGHHTLSLNAIIANRPLGEFSQNPYQVVENLIDYALGRLKFI